MRIWSIHPKYLDSKGIVALWRETLLAKNVLQCNTKGYKNHPQLIRFKQMDNPVESINVYLSYIYQEAQIRGYLFDNTKFDSQAVSDKITVTSKQIEYEYAHLNKKLKVRDNLRFQSNVLNSCIEAHPMFNVIEGEIEKWEVV